MIVLCTSQSVASNRVRNEVRSGLKRNVLIAVQLDPVDLPLEFSNVQTADLTDWKPHEAHAEPDKLVRRVSAKLGEASAAAVPPVAELGDSHRPSQQEPEREPEPERQAGRSRPQKEGATRDRRRPCRAPAIACAAHWWAADQAEVEVPELVGRSAPVATTLIDTHDLRRAPGTPVESENAAPGMVRDQSTPPGTRVKRGTVVEIAVAVWPHKTVPPLVGKRPGEAERIVAEAHLRLGRISPEATTAALPGTIVGQAPQPDVRGGSAGFTRRVGGSGAD